MKFIKRAVVLLLTLSLLCGVQATAYAHEIPDMGRKGSITIEMEYDGTAVIGGTMTVYQVGEVAEDDGNYTFVKAESMRAFSGVYEDLSSPELAEELAAFVNANAISPNTTVENQSGKVIFSNLKLGLYLIVQTQAAEGYEPLKPFLVSVPINEDGQYVYEVEARGKFQVQQALKPATPDTPVNQPGSRLPQTGQLNWPVPVLTVAGLLLFAFGWLLRFGRKKEYYEA